MEFLLRSFVLDSVIKKTLTALPLSPASRKLSSSAPSKPSSVQPQFRQEAWDLWFLKFLWCGAFERFFFCLFLFVLDEEHAEFCGGEVFVLARVC
ncbi:hypothetical protein GYH30_034904 [Glycine max]|nr:hypothetical protein GYH30_034904 [Glycine max]